MLKLKHKNFYILTFILLFSFQCFVIPLGSKFVVIGSILMMLSFGVAILHNYKHFLYTVNSFIKNKYARYFLCFVIWTILTGILLMILGKTTLKITSGHILTGLIYSMLLPLFFGFFLTKEISSQRTIKLLYICLYGMLLFGIFDFIIFYFDIMPLKKIYWFFVNSQHLRSASLPRTILFFGLPRIRSTFQEPCLWGYFLSIMLPFVYYFSSSKIKFIKNKYISILTKKTFPILAWFNIILNFSPIGIGMSILSTIIYFFCTRKHNIKKLIYFILSFFIFVFLLGIFMAKFEVGQKVLSRISSVQYLFSDFSKIVELEASLATRLVYYINCFIVGFKNIIFGVGWGHLGIDLVKQLYSSPVPLTYENIEICFIKGWDTTSFVESFACSIFGATGAIGFVLFYGFVIRIYRKLKSIFKQSFFFGDIKIVNIFSIYLILFVIFSFYESYVYYQYYWLMFGISIALISEYTNKCIILQKRSDNASINNSSGI